MPKEKYYKLCLYDEKDGKPCSINKLTQVVQDKSNPSKLNDLPIVGIEDGKGLIEFFSQLPVSDRPCAELSYVTRQPIDRGEFLKTVRDVTPEDIYRVKERLLLMQISRRTSVPLGNSPRKK